MAGPGEYGAFGAFGARSCCFSGFWGFWCLRSLGFSSQGFGAVGLELFRVFEAGPGGFGLWGLLVLEELQGVFKDFGVYLGFVLPLLLGLF